MSTIKLQGPGGPIDIVGLSDFIHKIPIKYTNSQSMLIPKLYSFNPSVGGFLSLFPEYNNKSISSLELKLDAKLKISRMDMLSKDYSQIISNIMLQINSYIYKELLSYVAKMKPTIITKDLTSDNIIKSTINIMQKFGSTNDYIASQIDFSERQLFYFIANPENFLIVVDDSAVREAASADITIKFTWANLYPEKCQLIRYMNNGLFYELVANQTYTTNYNYILKDYTT